MNKKFKAGIVGITAVCCLLGVAACGSKSSSNLSAGESNTDRTIKIEATTNSGVGGAVVSVPDAVESQTYNFTSTWSKTVTGAASHKDVNVYVAGNYQASSSQEVSCTILVNGKVVAHRSMTGSNANVYCATDGQTS